MVQLLAIRPRFHPRGVHVQSSIPTVSTDGVDRAEIGDSWPAALSVLLNVVNQENSLLISPTYPFNAPPLFFSKGAKAAKLLLSKTRTLLRKERT